MISTLACEFSVRFIAPLGWIIETRDTEIEIRLVCLFPRN